MGAADERRGEGLGPGRLQCSFMKHKGERGTHFEGVDSFRALSRTTATLLSAVRLNRPIRIILIIRTTTMLKKNIYRNPSHVSKLKSPQKGGRTG